METPEEVVGSSNEHTHIVKGKRTKIQRLSSPLSLTMATSSSYTDGDGGGSGGGSGSGGGYYDISSPTILAEFAKSTEEEEDMANCLILLAQGQGRATPKRMIEEGDGMERSSSRRFAEAAATSTNTNTGKQAAGFYVYECKTCNKCFPSFQALGGHRASHKKSKAMVEEKKALVLYEDHHEGQFNHNHSPSDHPLHLQIGNNRALYSNNKSRVHECSICGSEFSSGQALGGHMRRHRTPTAGTTTSMTIASESQEPKKPRSGFSLDLNLPAPDDEHHRESKFPFASKQPLIFSTSALVGCHY